MTNIAHKKYTKVFKNRGFFHGEILNLWRVFRVLLCYESTHGFLIRALVAIKPLRNLLNLHNLRESIFCHECTNRFIIRALVAKTIFKKSVGNKTH